MHLAIALVAVATTLTSCSRPVAESLPHATPSTRQGGCSGHPAFVAGDDWEGDEASGTPEASAAGKALQRQIEEAYRRHSTETLGRFFSDWAEASTPLSPVEVASLDPTERSAYAVFEAIYSPKDQSRLGVSEFGLDMYAKVPYLVAPGRMLVTCASDLRESNDVESDWEVSGYVRITRFRPFVKASDARVLYLTPDYEQALHAFLGGDMEPVGSGDSIMNPAAPRAESAARLAFLAPFILIVPGHWGAYWHVTSHPHIGRIDLDEELAHAVVAYRVGYQGGDASLQRDPNGRWDLVSAGLRWIE